MLIINNHYMSTIIFLEIDYFEDIVTIWIYFYFTVQCRHNCKATRRIDE